MTTCRGCRSLLSPMLDGELSIAEGAQVEDHLATCTACQREWNALQELDTKLTSIVQLPVRVNTKCEELASLSMDRNAVLNKQFEGSSVPRGAKADNWSLAIFALTAACLTALFLVPRFESSTDGEKVVANPILAGRLVRATGPVELMTPEFAQWNTLTTEEARELSLGVRLRTGPSVQCEIETPDKGIVRLDALAEVVIDKLNQFQLVKGRVWCRASSGSSIQLRLRSAETETLESQLAILTCPSSSEVQCENNSDLLSCCSDSNNQTTTQLSLGSFSCAVAPGESVSIDATQTVLRDPNQDITNKIWQLPLLAIDAGPDSELMQVLRPILSSIGMTKAIHMKEGQLRELGPLGAIPLLTYAATESASDRIELRRRAVRLATDLADQSSIPFFRKLSNDSDSQIATMAAEKLNSLIP